MSDVIIDFHKMTKQEMVDYAWKHLNRVISMHLDEDVMRQKVINLFILKHTENHEYI